MRAALDSLAWVTLMSSLRSGLGRIGKSLPYPPGLSYTQSVTLNSFLRWKSAYAGLGLLFQLNMGQDLSCSKYRIAFDVNVILLVV